MRLQRDCKPDLRAMLRALSLVPTIVIQHTSVCCYYLNTPIHFPQHHWLPNKLALRALCNFGLEIIASKPKSHAPSPARTDLQLNRRRSRSQPLPTKAPYRSLQWPQSRHLLRLSSRKAFCKRLDSDTEAPESQLSSQL